MVGAAAAALLLALTAPAPEPIQAVDGAVCEANPKPANLNFTMKDMHGKDVAAAPFKGKVILLDFWATWCGPCKIEIPWFIEFHSKYQSQGLVVLGVSVDDSPEDLRQYAGQMKMNYPVLVGDGRRDLTDEQPYGPVWGMPTTFLIGRDGKICRRHVGLASKDQFEREIRALL